MLVKIKIGFFFSIQVHSHPEQGPIQGPQVKNPWNMPVRCSCFVQTSSITPGWWERFWNQLILPAAGFPGAVTMLNWKETCSALGWLSDVFERVFEYWNMFSLADSSNFHTAQDDSWTSENFWLDPSVKGQLETKEEDDGLRQSLDRFYEMFSHPQPAFGNPLSASVSQCLSQKINELKGQENQRYALRSFQMARVILNRDGCSVLRKHSRDAHFYAPGEGSMSLEDEKPTPGL